VRDLQVPREDLVLGHDFDGKVDRADGRRQPDRIAVRHSQGGGVVRVHLHLGAGDRRPEARDVAEAAVEIEELACPGHEHERPGGVRLAPVGGAVIDRELVVPEVLEVRGGELDLPGGRAEAGLPAPADAGRAVLHPLPVCLQRLQAEPGRLEQPAVEGRLVLPREVLADPEPYRQVVPEVVLALDVRPRHHLVGQAHDLVLGVRVQLGAFEERGGRQHVVGHGGRLGHEQVADHQEVERAQGLEDLGGVGVRGRRVGARHHQRPERVRLV